MVPLGALVDVRVSVEPVQTTRYVRTEDADLILERSGASEAALLEALESIHACWISDERDPATGLERLVPVSPSYVRGEHLMMLTTDLGFLDLYDYIPGFPDMPVADVFSDSIELDLPRTGSSERCVP
jgi:hypothetical protein